MTNPIPDDIMQEAGRLFTDARMSACVDAATCIENIARALLAERRKTAERCAEIVEENAEWDKDASSYASDIRRAFLEPSQEQEG